MSAHGGLFGELLLLLAASVALIVLLHRLRGPSLLAFLAIGVAAGPGGLGIVSDVEGMHALAEFGVVFLLFTLGLEFSLPRLVALRGTVFGIGSLQVLLCGAVFFAVLWAAGLGIAAAVVVAGGLALSSTAIVSRELVATGQLHTRHGQVSIGILLFQDIAAVFLLILLPVLSGSAAGSVVERLADPLLRGTLLLLAMLAAGRWLLPRLLEESARTRSEELFMLTALLVALLAAWITQLAGLSMALGAFLGGMVLGESRFRHQIESDIRPFRDLLLGVFFISVGLMMDLQMLAEYWPRIVVFGLLLVLVKGAVIAAMTRALRESADTSLRTGLALAQGGEFFFALVALASRERLVPNDVASFLIAVTVVSMALTPLLLRNSERIAGWLLPRLPRLRTARTSAPPLPESTPLADACAELDQHVVILGYGRVGQTIARFLRLQHVPFVALDTDVVRVREAAIAGDNVFFGDPVRRDILHAAGIERATLVIVSFDHVPSALRIIEHARALRADVPILVRTRDDQGLAELQAAGATAVVPETLEAGLMLVSHVFVLLGVPPRQILRLLEQTRRQRYQLLHGYYEGTYDRLQHEDEHAEVLHAVPLPPQAHAVGRTLGAIDFGSAEVRAVRRGAASLQSPGADWVCAPGDIVLLSGTHAEVGAAEDRLLAG